MGWLSSMHFAPFGCLACYDAIVRAGNHLSSKLMQAAQSAPCVMGADDPGPCNTTQEPNGGCLAA